MIIFKSVKLKVLLIIILIVPFTLSAQSNNEQDDNHLFDFIEEVIEGGGQLIIAKSHINIDNDSTRLFYHDLLNEFQAKETGLSNSQKLQFYIAIGMLEHQYKMLNECILNYNRALELCIEEPNERCRLFITLKLAEAYGLSGNFALSNKLNYEGLNHPLLDSSDVPRHSLQSSIAGYHEVLGEHVEAMDACLILQDVYLEKNMLAEASYNLIQLGRIASHLETDTLYFEYYHQAVEMAYKSGRESRISNNLVNLAIAYRTEGYPEMALKHYAEAKEYNEFSRPFPQAYYYINLSKTLLNLGRADEALENARISFNKGSEIEANLMEYDACNMISKCYESMGQNDSAILYLQKALKYRSITFLANDYGKYRHLSKLSTKMDDYKLALVYLDSAFMGYAKTVENKNSQKLAELRVKSDYYIHRTRIGELVIANQLEKEKSTRAFIIISAFVVFFIIIVFFVIIIRKRHEKLQESYVNLVQKNIELDKLNKLLDSCEQKSNYKNGLDDIKDEEQILKKLKRLLVQENVYTNHSVSLASLSKLLKTNTSYLSAIINAHYNCNFRTLINRYRINKAREIIVSKEFAHYSMEGIAQEVGFKSRSTFHAAFKNETGLSPALYIENYRLLEKERIVL